MNTARDHDTNEVSENARKAQLLLSVLRAMIAMGVLGFVSSLFDARNDVRFSVVFYCLAFAGIYGMYRVVRRGHVVLAAWSVSIFFWLIIAFVTLFFGGMQGQNAASFGVSAMLVGSVVSGRAGVAVAVFSSVWCAFVAWLEIHGKLPPQIGPYSPVNAWSAFTVTLIMMAVLMRNALESVRATHAKAVAAAADRDEALRRSIQAQKMELVGNLASGVAHDFNNLLVVMSAVSDSLRHELGKDSDGTRAMLDDLDDATTRATLMTRQLLSLGRTEPSELKRLDLDESVRAIVPMLRRLLGSNITIEIHSAPGAFVRATRVGLEQVLLNLAVNARDAMPNGGAMSVRTRIEDDVIVLAVRDAGVGMDAATRERIFAPFFTTKAQGTGLGLATVQEKVQQLGGSITVDSAPGEGATFEIRFPHAPTSAASAPRSTPRAGVAMQRAREGLESTPANGAARPRLLVVDDDPLVRRATARLLEQDGYEVVTVNDGAEALTLLAPRHSFVCVVSDISMPNLDGEQLAARLAESDPELPVVLMSGNRMPDGSFGGRRRVFIAKPMDRAALREAIEQVCAED